jgi:hypothetical protein
MFPSRDREHSNDEKSGVSAQAERDRKDIQSCDCKQSRHHQFSASDVLDCSASVTLSIFATYWYDEPRYHGADTSHCPQTHVERERVLGTHTGYSNQRFARSGDWMQVLTLLKEVGSPPEEPVATQRNHTHGHACDLGPSQIGLFEAILGSLSATTLVTRRQF